ncbi:MAG: hypothetical protein OEL83_11095 [Desulforhopalus sp.]|nr:hypothetical protein [Desulforhopalus sp.]
MQITNMSNPAPSSGVSILKSANEQPKLAGELINRTVEDMVQIQAAQSPSQRIDISEITGTGKIINTTA